MYAALNVPASLYHSECSIANEFSSEIYYVLIKCDTSQICVAVGGENFIVWKQSVDHNDCWWKNCQMKIFYEMHSHSSIK